jgi:hypothetical protein
MSRNTASRQERIGEVLFVTVKHPRQSLKRAFFRPNDGGRAVGLDRLVGSGG